MYMGGSAEAERGRRSLFDKHVVKVSVSCHFCHDMVYSI